jgi:hypothetical protein
LLRTVPLLGRVALSDNVNSDYTNDNQYLKNCYLTFDGERGEDSYYGHMFAGAKDCIDFLGMVESELCYESVHCTKSYGLRYARYCVNCSDSWFLRDCIGCSQCFGCANLRQKKYCIFNEQKTKEEYEAFMQAFRSGSYTALQEMQRQFEIFQMTLPCKPTRGEQNQNVTGDMILNSQNSWWCFDSYNLQDCAYCSECIVGAKDVQDLHIWGDNTELVYNSCCVGVNIRNVIGGYYVSEGADSVYYSAFCSKGCKNLFGCVGLRKTENCILNKRYSKEEYEELAKRIARDMAARGEWGEYFDPKTALYGYNETMAQVHFPLSREQALAKGWTWSDYEAPVEAERTIEARLLPDTIDETPDDILNWAVLCEVTGKPFRVIAQELSFYRTHHLPIPRRHPDQRHRDRWAYKNPYFLWERECMNCHKKVMSSYSPERPETIYCEECYLGAVY